ncbi:MAG TPA: ABC transporter permease [Thermoanaerobaculaceae bacterium]|nr:ABC transporter permease [Thermoanaerobaculaceae bacterium]HPS79346.1 ABC transporter permease [Thermoanaerobaculaceae bacterium]
MGMVWLDLRVAARGLVKAPGFTAVVALTLALGIGATTGVFSALHAALLASLPYQEPDRLVLGRRTQDGRVGAWVSMLDYLDYREQTTSFSSLATTPWGSFRVSSTGGDRPERINAQMVSYNLFSTLGVAPPLGRTFSAEDGAPSPQGLAGSSAPMQLPSVGLISYGYWQKRFAGSPDVLGRSLTLAGQAVTVIGVMPEGYRFRDDADVWLPMQRGPGEARRFHNWLVVGRLKPGVELAAAQAEIDAISSRLASTYPESNRGKGLLLAPLHDSLVQDLRPGVLLIMAAVALMLLIASGNVASLLLARGVTRRNELAMRVALGASRTRLVRQLVTESLVLALVGGLAGLVVAGALQRVLPALLGFDALAITSLRLDWRILGFASVVSLLTGVLVGLVPALRSTRIAPFEELKGAGTRTATSGSGARLRMGLVAAQVTLSLVLLVGSSLLIRSFAKLVRTDLGFDPDNLLTASLSLPPQQYASDEARIQFFEELLAGVRALPGVTAAGMIDRPPIYSPGGDIYVWTPDKPPKDRGLGQTSLSRRVLPGYFAAMRMPLVAGREIEPGDRTGTPPVLVINQTMARTLFGTESPLGRKVVVDMGGDDPVTFDVVGVVADARVSRVGSAPYLTMYHSYYQFPRASLTLAIRSAADPQELTGALRELVWRRDKDIPIEELATMKAAIRSSTLAQQTLAGTVTSFSLLALLLAAVGLFGVLAYQVNERRHEIGIRMALGARPGHVLTAILGQGLKVTGVGLGAGVVAGLALTRLMEGLLYEVAATDPASFLGAAACLLAVALLACLAPSLRALRIQPMTALHYE